MTFTTDASSWPARPVILITGGNTGVGYGVALRLLRQLSEPICTDIALATGSIEDATPSAFTTPNGATIILACRNAVKAHRAAESLRKAVGSSKDDRQGKLRRKVRALNGELDDMDDSSSEKSSVLDRAAYRRRWLDNLRIEFSPIDLSSVDSVLKCATDVKRRHGYITHLICNAGGGPFTGLDWPLAIRTVLTRFIEATTYPIYLKQRTGDMTEDGLGWTWQTNVFGHWLLARELLPALAAAPHSSPRILWTGSIDGLPFAFEPNDPQAIKHEHSYQSAKFECSLAAWSLNSVIAKQGGSVARIRSFAVEPGVTAGGMFREILGFVLDLCMKAAFYISRWLGSPNHVLVAYNAALVFTYVSLAPFSILALHSRTAREHAEVDQVDQHWEPVRFGARADRWGRPYVAADVFDPSSVKGRSKTPVRADRWWFDEDLARDTAERCERLRDKMLERRDSKR